MAVQDKVLGAFLVSQIVLAAVIVALLSCTGGNTYLGYLSIYGYPEVIALLISASTNLITSLLLFTTMFSSRIVTDEMVKTSFYRAFHLALALLLIGSGIAVLAIEVPMKLKGFKFEDILDQNIAGGTLGIICGFVNGANYIKMRKID